MFEQKNFTHKEVVITSDLLSENTESGRYYVLEDGKKLPSVTTVTGWKKNKFLLSGVQTTLKKQRESLVEVINSIQ